MLTVEALNKMKKVVTNDEAVIIQLIPSDYTCYYDIIANIAHVFFKVIKMKVSNKSCVLVAMVFFSACIVACNEAPEFIMGTWAYLIRQSVMQTSTKKTHGVLSKHILLLYQIRHFYHEQFHQLQDIHADTHK